MKVLIIMLEPGSNKGTCLLIDIEREYRKIVIKQKNPYFYPVQNTASTILSAPDTVGKRCPECLYRHMGIPKTPSKDTFHLPVQAVV